MACSIFRNKETNEIEKVLAPNSKESILFNNILNIITDKEEALKAWAQVYTPSFKAWFGDWEKGEGSKVVDSNGEPLLVYHGTGNKFNEFDKALRGETTGRSTTGEYDSENAFFFSNNENVSFNYAIMARQQELEFISSSLVDLRSSFISTERKQKLYNDLRKESPKFANYIDGLKSKGLNQQQIMEKVTELSIKYSNLSRDYSKGGAISNPRRYYRNVKEHVSRLIKNKENILQGKYDVKSIYDDKTLRTTDKNNKNLAVYDDGLILFNEEAFPEISNLQRKKITDLSSNEFDNLMAVFLKTVKQGEEKIADDLKKGGFTAEIMPVFLNAKNVVKKDFEEQPFVMQVDGKGAANEASKLTLKAKEDGKDGVIFENIKDPELANNYGVFEPNQIKSLYNEGQFSEKTNNIYNQLEGVPASKASKETIEKVKKVIEQMGVNIVALQDYLKGNPDVNAKDATALADLVQGIIAIAEGKEGVALTEEMVHIATAIIEQVNPQLVTNLISKISQYKIYNIVLEKYKKNKAYQLPNGKPNIRKIKKEAVDKLIAEMIINMSEGTTEFPELLEKESRNLVQQMWDAILSTIRSLYKKSDINLFQQTAQQISEGNLGAGIEVLEGVEDQGIFFQLEENQKVNEAFGKFKDMNDRMDFIDASETEKRHYKYDENPLEFTVTTLKKKKDFKRTDEDKLLDDQKKSWGSEGHDFLEKYTKKNLINKDGYALPTDREEEIATPLNDDVKKSIIIFAKELIASYEDGTRFLIETYVANLKVKGGMGSKIDFMAFEPVKNSKGEPDVKVDILDWKFTSFNTESNTDIPWFKQDDWKAQMGEYTKIAYNLGIERNQLRRARMIPFITNYRYAIKNNKASGLVPSSIEVGKVDSLQETNVYLLPVPVDFESTGNEAVDTFIASLRKLYEKMYKSSAKPEDKFSKNLKLEQLSLAIRNLHLKLNFFPVYDVAKTFLNDMELTIQEFDGIDFTTLSKDELNTKLEKLIEYQRSAEKFTQLSDVYISYIPRENMTTEELKLLNNFDRLSAGIKRKLKDILTIQQEYVLQKGLKEGIVEEENVDDILKAEKLVSSLDKNFLESSKLSPLIIQLAAKVYLKAKNLINVNFSKVANNYSKILIPLEEEARAKGKTAFEMVGTLTEKGPRLIKKLDSKFLEDIKTAKEKGNKQFLLDNLDVEEYKRLTDPVIERTLEDLDRTQFSSDETEDEQIRERRKSRFIDSIDITSKDFDGFENYTFQYYYRQAMIEEGHLSKEFLEMSKSENALKVWNFFTELNEKARKMGYLDKQGLSFFPLIEATTLQKMSQSGNILKETKDFFKDMYSINPNEEQLYAKVDEETGELKRVIPKYFTRTNKDVAQLSTDLNKVGLMWIKSLMEYESSKDLEFPLLVMHSVENSKGSLITDNKGEVIFEGQTPKERAENENANLLEAILDDYLYGITENLNSMGNILMTSTVSRLSKNKDKIEQRTISTKKLLKTGDTYIRTLALGLKPLVGAANWFGTQFQMYINSSGFYLPGEFEKNNVKVTLPIGKLSLIEKALLDTVSPLTGESIVEIKQRMIAEKKSYASYLATWTFSDVMMSTNSFGEKKLELTNALTMIDNSIVINGKIINIRQHLRALDRQAKKGMAFEQRRELEKSFEERVKKLKEGNTALKKLSKIENDELIIEGVSSEELAKFRMSIVDFSRNLTGQMSNDDKMGYRRDTIFNSFMMFKGWIPKLLSARYKNITKNTATDEWEYGRYRAFFSTLSEIGYKNITDLRDVVLGTDKGLAIINEMLEAKKQQYYLQTGKELNISEEEFQDLIRAQVTNMFKELKLIVGLLALLIAAKIAAPDDDDDDLTKNRYKYIAKLVNKVSDELLFYVNPASADEMTKGSIIPTLGIFTKVGSLLNAVRKEVYYTAIGDEKGVDKTYPLKYFINLFPIGYQGLNEALPYIDAELAKEMGVRVTSDSRRR